MITYVKGDATAPIDTNSHRIIMHVCNNAGGWGRGFVVAISNRWKQPEAQYRKWYKNKHDDEFGEFALGNVSIVTVQENLHVANMIAQVGYGRNNTLKHRDGNEIGRRINYDALALCLQKVRDIAATKQATIHAPRIGCGLAGGDWDVVEKLINEYMYTTLVYIYDL